MVCSKTIYEIMIPLVIFSTALTVVVLPSACVMGDHCITVCLPSLRVQGTTRPLVFAASFIAFYCWYFNRLVRIANVYQSSTILSEYCYAKGGTVRKLKTQSDLIPDQYL